MMIFFLNFGLSCNCNFRFPCFIICHRKREFNCTLCIPFLDFSQVTGNIATVIAYLHICLQSRNFRCRYVAVYKKCVHAHRYEASCLDSASFPLVSSCTLSLISPKNFALCYVMSASIPQSDTTSPNLRK